MNMVQRAFTFLVALTAAVCVAQTTQPLAQTFHAPKADIEQALKDLNAYDSGKLPFVEGFVGNISTPLSSFQRAYYQYAITVTQKSETEVDVAVNAKISAWYEDKDPAKSGYRDLPSSGRLEADLLERLRQRLRRNAETAEANREPLVSRRLLGIPDPPSSEVASAPDAPTSSSPAAPSFRTLAPGAASDAEKKTTGAEPSEDARMQRLQNEERILTGVLAAQEHPQDLVTIKGEHTRIVSAPSETGRVVMYADAEDEFQLLKVDGDWVHIQIAGPNRGWVKRSQVELAADAAPGTVPAAAPAEIFRNTKEETGTFPGDWPPLRGKNVKIIWVQPTGKTTQKGRLSYAESVFKKQVPALKSSGGVDGVVIVFDAAEGGMAAAPLAALQQWGSGNLSETAFLKQCWFDPQDAFTPAASR